MSARQAVTAAESHNAGVNQPLAPDTPFDVERRQIEGWRRMSPAEKAAIVAGLTQSAYAMTLAGVRHRYPQASARECFLRVALITLGPSLASAAYPDAAALVPPT
jgi:hypothetical protein